MQKNTVTDGTGRLVLVVEDDAAIRECLELLLRHYGFHVDTSDTVARGMELLGREPEFLLLDLMLPDGDGTRLLERVIEKQLRTQVVVVTGTCDALKVKHVERLRPAKIVHKPLDMMNLMETLRGVETDDPHAAAAVDSW